MDYHTKINQLINQAVKTKHAIKDLKARYNSQRNTLQLLLKRRHITRFNARHYLLIRTATVKGQRFSVPLLRKLAPSIYKDHRYYKHSIRHSHLQIRHKVHE